MLLQAVVFDMKSLQCNVHYLRQFFIYAVLPLHDACLHGYHDVVVFRQNT